MPHISMKGELPRASSPPPVPGQHFLRPLSPFVTAPGGLRARG
jgi:hypothetical protein